MQMQCLNTTQLQRSQKSSGQFALRAKYECSRVLKVVLENLISLYQLNL